VGIPSLLRRMERNSWRRVTDRFIPQPIQVPLGRPPALRARTLVRLPVRRMASSWWREAIILATQLARRFIPPLIPEPLGSSVLWITVEMPLPVRPMQPRWWWLELVLVVPALAGLSPRRTAELLGRRTAHLSASGVPLPLRPTEPNWWRWITSAGFGL